MKFFIQRWKDKILITKNFYRSFSSRTCPLCSIWRMGWLGVCHVMGCRPAGIKSRRQALSSMEPEMGGIF